MNKRPGISPWRFDRSSLELICDDRVVHLEKRAAETLSLLLARQGQVVSKRDIIDSAWGGRHVSENSVSIVIGALRRSLGKRSDGSDWIETISKAGYRLHPPIPAASPRTTRTVAMTVAIGALGTVAALALVATIPNRPTKPQLYVQPIVNRTGDPRNNVLAEASTALLIDRLGREIGDSATLRTTPPPTGEPATARLETSLTLWNVTPDVTMRLSTSDGRLLWSGSAYGDPDAIAVRLQLAAREVARRFKADRAGEAPAKR